MLSVSVVLLLAAAAILVGVVAAALGRGGELAHFAADTAPSDGRGLSAADIALNRPPAALFGYSQRITDEILGAAARTVTERDREIARLQWQVAELRRQAGGPAEAGPSASGPAASASGPAGASGPDYASGPPSRSGLPAASARPLPGRAGLAHPLAWQRPQIGRSLASRRPAAGESAESRPPGGQAAAEEPADLWRPRTRASDE
jgi:hypothetical protein